MTTRTSLAEGRTRAHIREVEKQLRLLEKHGWRFRDTGNNHFRGYCSCGAHTGTVPGTPSDHRSLINSLKRFQRMPCWTSITT